MLPRRWEKVGDGGGEAVPVVVGVGVALRGQRFAGEGAGLRFEVGYLCFHIVKYSLPCTSALLRCSSLSKDSFRKRAIERASDVSKGCPRNPTASRKWQVPSAISSRHHAMPPLWPVPSSRNRSLSHSSWNIVPMGIPSTFTERFSSRGSERNCSS